MPSRLLLRGLILAVFAVGVASAQTIPFILFATENGSSATIPNDYTLPFSTGVGTLEQATVRAVYTGTLPATLTQAIPVGLLGSTEFTVTSTATAGLVLNPSDSFSFQITFAPTNATGAGAQLTIPFTVPGAGGTPVSNSIVLNLQGTSPAFTLSYVLLTNNNVVQIPSGGTIPFGATKINTTAQANLQITNTGSGPGVITGISQTAGSPIFQLQSIPLLPGTLAAGATLTLPVIYNPTAVESDTGQIQITYQGGVTATVNLTGSGATSAFTYKYLVQGKATTVKPGETIGLPAVDVGVVSSVIVEVTNTGNASGTINSISISPPFVLADVPITLPTLKPGDSFPFSIELTPTGVGTQTGQLVVGSDFFNLSGEGLGPKLTFSYTSSAGSTTVDPANGGAVLFNPTEVGQSGKVTFTVTNSGSLPATIALIGTNPSNGPFTASPPALPKALAPSQSLLFTITFTPTVQGISDGTLVVNTTMIPLSGNATAPPALPSYTISGPSGNALPLTQSNVSLTLSKGYPLDLTGTLVLTTQGTLGTDQSVQFDTGGRTVNFTIPANSTSANFAGQGTELPLQTGTVAETVTLAPTFTTAGGVNVTPASPTTLQFTIASAAPVLLTSTISGATTNSFNLVLTGYSTTRSLGSLNVTFNPAAGFNITTTVPPIDLSQVSTAWFLSSASATFGGQFQVTMPFTLTGPVKTGQTLLQAIASVTATVSNSIGTSKSLTAIVP
jgi:HYDIN/CFA65/VesB-like, Ig-like domain